jgi:hypothetical protein
MMLLALAASLAIVVSDHASIRSTPRSTATELMTLWQGDVVEVRGEQAEYLKVYSYRRERGGYLRHEAVRQVAFEEEAAPDLLAVMRFLRDSPGSEALGISYGAAYLKAVSPKALTAEPFDAIGQMAERLASAASGNGTQAASVAARLEVVGQFGVRMRSFERNGRMQVCYDGELFRRVLAQPTATPEQQARAVLALTRQDCIDPALGPVARAALDDERRVLLERIHDADLTPAVRGRVHARRAVVWSAIAYERARHTEAAGVAAGAAAGAAAQRAIAELAAVRPSELGEFHQAEYADALLRVSAIRWATAPPPTQASPLALGSAAGQAGRFVLTTAPAEPGQTCIALEQIHPSLSNSTLARRCTFGIVWLASAQLVSQGPLVVLSVQPLESWRELWVFHPIAGKWIVDVLSPGVDDPEQGYVDYAGFAPATARILLAREVKEHSHYRRWFEEVQLDDLILVRQASAPDLLRDFGRWQDVRWRRETLALR